MARRKKAASRGGRGRREKEVESTNESDVNYSVDDLLQKAEENLSMFQPEIANKFFERVRQYCLISHISFESDLKALEMEPNNTQVLDAFAAFLLDFDDFAKAKQISFLLLSNHFP